MRNPVPAATSTCCSAVRKKIRPRRAPEILNPICVCNPAPLPPLQHIPSIILFFLLRKRHQHTENRRERTTVKRNTEKICPPRRQNIYLVSYAFHFLCSVSRGRGASNPFQRHLYCCGSPPFIPAGAACSAEQKEPLLFPTTPTHKPQKMKRNKHFKSCAVHKKPSTTVCTRNWEGEQK